MNRQETFRGRCRAAFALWPESYFAGLFSAEELRANLHPKCRTTVARVLSNAANGPRCLPHYKAQRDYRDTPRLLTAFSFKKPPRTLGFVEQESERASLCPKF